ncbi:MAG: hypothetical protein ACKOSQ_00140 [Planctomycetaceae bacterium]
MSEVYEFEISQGGGPPAGNYRATFEGVEQTTHEEYGAGLRWKWKVVDGPQAGVIASRTTAPKPTTGNAAGKLIAAMTGATLAGGQKASVRDCVGKTFLISVMPTKSGSGTRVETAIPL